MSEAKTRRRPGFLRKLVIDRVDLVDAGANPDADILLFKRRDGPGAEGGVNKAKTKTENGQEYPAEAYAYVPDPDKPSTWKLRLWETPEKKETAAQVGRAIAALGEGFRGNKVEIPKEDLPKVLERVRAAWRKTHPDASEDEMPEVIRKAADGMAAQKPLDSIRGILAAIAKRLGLRPEEVAKADDAVTFSEALAEQQFQRVSSEVYDLLFALHEAITSTLRDPTVDREALIRGSLDQFAASVEAALPSWLAGQTMLQKVGRKIAGERLARLKAAWEELGRIIAEAEDQPAGGDGDVNKIQLPDPDEPGREPKGDEPDVGAIDKSKLPEDVRKHIEALEARATAAEAELAKLKGQRATDDDVAKALMDLPESHPIRKALADAQRRAEEAEKIAKAEREARVNREYIEKAAGFRNLPGVKPEEFGPILRKAAETLGDDYAKVEAVLKAADEAIAKGALFKEIGTSGGPPADSAQAQIEALAGELLVKGAAKTKAEAVVKALELRPELAAKYREETRAH